MQLIPATAARFGVRDVWDPEQNLRGMLYWLMGDLSFAYEPGRVLWLMIALAIAGRLSISSKEPRQPRDSYSGPPNRGSSG